MNAIAARNHPCKTASKTLRSPPSSRAFPPSPVPRCSLKLAHHPIAGGVVSFVVAASTFHGLLTPWLAPKFPKFFKNSYEPLFFDARLSFAEKLSQWRAQPVVSLQLVTQVMMLSVLAVGVVSLS